MEAPVGMWIQSGTTPNKTSRKYNSARQFLHNFRQDLTLRGARWGLSDRFLYLLAHCWCPGTALGTTLGHQKEHLGPPWRTFAARNQKTTKKKTFWGPVLKPRLADFSVFLGFAFTCLSEVAGDVQMTPKCLEKVCPKYTF